MAAVLAQTKIRRLDASDERQYMMNEKYEVYEKQGAPFGALSFHYHNFYEIIYVLEGEYSSMLEERTYHMKKGDFLLIDRNVMHKYHYIEKKHDSSKRIILWITGAMLETLSEGDFNLAACFSGHDSRAYHFPIYYEELLRGYLLRLAMWETPETGLSDFKAVLDKGYLTLFFVYLNALCQKKEYFFREQDSVDHPMVAQVSAYIEEHISETIPVEELAWLVHMSKYHFLRKFKEVTGVTVHTFLINKRLIKASKALKEGMGVTQVCQLAGFGDYSSFLRNFKKIFGVSPAKYRDFY